MYHIIVFLHHITLQYLFTVVLVLRTGSTSITGSAGIIGITGSTSITIG